MSLKLAMLAVLYSRSTTSSFLEEFVKEAVDTCIDYLQVSKKVLTAESEEDGSINTIIIDFIAAVLRVLVLDSVFSHTLISGANENMYQTLRSQLPAEVDDVFDQLPIDSSAEKETCWRAQSNQFTSLQNDPNVASFLAYVLSLPVKALMSHDEDVGTDCDGENDNFDEEKIIAMKGTHDQDGISSNSSPSRRLSDQSMQYSSPAKIMADSDGNENSPELSSSEKTKLYGRFKSFSADFDDSRSDHDSSPVSSPVRQPSKNNLFPDSSQSSLHRSSAVSPTALQTDYNSAPPKMEPLASRLKLQEVTGSSLSKNHILSLSSVDNDDTDVMVKSESLASTGMTQSLSSSAISSMPYQPPPASWGLGAGVSSDTSDIKVSPCRSTAGATTTSSMSSAIPSTGLSVGSDQEDWQRLSLATPHMYLPTTANSSSGTTQGVGERVGVFTPSKDEPLDKSKLKTLKRPGRNLRSSNTAGANAVSTPSERMGGELRAYTAGESCSASAIDGEGINQWKGDRSVHDSAGKTSSSFSGRYGAVGEAIDQVNAMDIDSNKSVDNPPTGTNRTPMKRKARTNPTMYSTPPRHDQSEDLLPDIGSATPYEKGTYKDNGQRIHQLMHPNSGGADKLEAGINEGIGVRGKHTSSSNQVLNGTFNQTSRSVAQIFDDDDYSPDYEVFEGQDLVHGITPRHLGQKSRPPVQGLDLSIEIESSSLHPLSDQNNFPPGSDLGPYIESPAVRRGKKIGMSPSARANKRLVSGNKVPTLVKEEGSDSDSGGEKNKKFPTINNAEYGTDDNGTPLHKPADSLEYTNSEDIKPMNNPSKELTAVAKGLDTDGWPDIFHTIDKLRQLALHHNSTVLNSSYLHPMVMGVVKQVDNLRSAVCKNALLAISDMFVGFGKSMDGESQNVMPILLKRCSDSSAFLSGSANAALCSMMERSSVQRAITLLMQYGADHKVAGIRAATVNGLSHLATVRINELKVPACKESLDVVKSRLSKFITDPNPSVRSQSREIVRQLVLSGLFSRTQLEVSIDPGLVAKSLQEQSANSIAPSPLARYSRLGDGGGLEIVADSSTRKNDKPSPRKGSRKLGVPSGGTIKIKRPSVVSKAREEIRQYDSADCSESPSVSPRYRENIELGVSGSGPGGRDFHGRGEEGHRYSALQAAHAKQEMETIGDLVELPEAVKKLSSKNWLERNEAISHITDAVLENSGILATAGKLEGILDAVLEKFEDGSVKVCIHAITCMAKVNNALPEVLPSMYSTVVPAFLLAASSANR